MLIRVLMWGGLCALIVWFGACQESLELQSDPTCSPAPHLSKHPLWQSTLGGDKQAAHACLRVVWGDGVQQARSQLIRLSKAGTMRARSQPNATDFSVPVQLDLPQAADGKPLRFHIFVFGADYQNQTLNAMDTLCNDTMKQPSYQCLSNAEAECWFALNIRPGTSDSSRVPPLAGSPGVACKLQIRAPLSESTPELGDAGDANEPTAPDTQETTRDEPSTPDEPGGQDEPLGETAPPELVPEVRPEVTPDTCAGMPGQPEVCDGKDNDCDGLVDEGLPNCQQSVCKGQYPCVVTAAGPPFYLHEFPQEYLRLKQPRGLAFDAKAKHLYVSDAGTNTIWKIDALGVVTAFAGFVRGDKDAKGIEAQFSSPHAMIFDGKGNLYVADTGNHKIKKIDPQGNVTTVAGSSSGFQDGGVAIARFSSPRGLAFDGKGNLYVADAGTQRIRKIDTKGQVTTLAGGTRGQNDGVGPNAQFNTPYGLTWDGSNHLYVADTKNNWVRKINLSSGSTTTFPDRTKLSSEPHGVAFDTRGHLYVTSQDKRVYEIDTAGNITTLAGGSDWGFVDGKGAGARFKRVHAIIFDGKDLIVTDEENNTVRKIDLIGNVTSHAGRFSFGLQDGRASQARFDRIEGLAFDDQGNLYITDTSFDRIRKLDTSKLVSTLLGKGWNQPFSSPTGLVFDEKTGLIYIADTKRHEIKSVTSAKQVSTIAGSMPGDKDGKGSLAQLLEPNAVILDGKGNLYVADTKNHKIKKIDPQGNVTTVAGSDRGDSDGKGASAKFNSPHGLAFDQSGTLYVADTENHKIRKIDPQGNVTTFAGSNQGDKDHNIGIFAQFDSPHGLAFDQSGILYVADTENHKIKTINPQGKVTTLAGSTSNYRDGPPSVAMFHAPLRLAFDKKGELYVADTGNFCIRKIIMKAPTP